MSPPDERLPAHARLDAPAALHQLDSRLLWPLDEPASDAPAPLGTSARLSGDARVGERVQTEAAGSSVAFVSRRPKRLRSEASLAKLAAKREAEKAEYILKKWGRSSDGTISAPAAPATSSSAPLAASGRPDDAHIPFQPRNAVEGPLVGYADSDDEEAPHGRPSQPVGGAPAMRRMETDAATAADGWREAAAASALASATAQATAQSGHTVAGGDGMATMIAQPAVSAALLLDQLSPAGLSRTKAPTIASVPNADANCRREDSGARDAPQEPDEPNEEDGRDERHELDELQAAAEMHERGPDKRRRLVLASDDDDVDEPNKPTTASTSAQAASTLSVCQRTPSLR